MSDEWGRARFCAACKFQRVTAEVGNACARVASTARSEAQALLHSAFLDWKYEGMGPPSGSPLASSTGGSSGAVGMYMLIARGSGEGRRSLQSVGILEAHVRCKRISP